SSNSSTPSRRTSAPRTPPTASTRTRRKRNAAMAEPVLKFPGGPSGKARETAKSLKARLLARRRLVLLVVLPAIVAVAGLTFYLSGGRYVSTDNAYVGAQKVLITPSVSGTIKQVAVKEGQRVNAGDELFQIDPDTYRLVLQQAEARL